MKTAFLPRKARLASLFAAALFLSPNVAMAQMASGSADPVLPDPVPNRGVQIPASAATADVAYGGQPKPVLHNDCTTLNPCALPSSAPHKLGALPSGSL